MPCEAMYRSRLWFCYRPGNVGNKSYGSMVGGLVALVVLVNQHEEGWEANRQIYV